MHSEPAVAPPATPGRDRAALRSCVSEAASRAPASSPGGCQPVRFALRKVMSAMPGNTYMVGAYPPDWAASSTGADQARRGEDGAPPAAAVVSATPSKGR